MAHSDEHYPPADMAPVPPVQFQEPVLGGTALHSAQTVEVAFVMEGEGDITDAILPERTTRREKPSAQQPEAAPSKTEPPKAQRSRQVAQYSTEPVLRRTVRLQPGPAPTVPFSSLTDAIRKYRRPPTGKGA